MLKLPRAPILFFATIFAADLSAEDASNSSEIVRKPFVAYAWHGPQVAYGNVVKMFWVTRRTTPEQAKAATDTMPEGRRVLMKWDLHGRIHNHPEDRCRDDDGNLTNHRSVWWEHGVEENAELYEDFFRRYHALGGRLDTFVMDHEVGLSNWSIRKNEDLYRAIMADRRFDALSRQLGFRDLLVVSNWQRQRGEKRTHYLIWNAVMHERVTAYFNTAFYDPIRKYYPNVNLSNYGHCDGKPPHTCVPGWHDYHRFSTGAPMHVGTHQSRALYCVIGQLRDRILPGCYRPYGNSPFAGFRVGVNKMRSMALSSPVPIAPWISHKRFFQSTIWYTDLYQELIFHVGLSGADVFLLWNPYVWGRRRGDPVVDAGLQTKLVSDCLKQLDELVGTGDRKTRIKGLADWRGEFVVTGMNAAGRSVWRFTPKLGRGQQREDMLVSESPAVFRVGPKRIHFPSGKVYWPKTDLSSQGFWVVAPPESRPTITTDWSPFVTAVDRESAAEILKQFDRDRDSAIGRHEMMGTALAKQRFWFVGDADEDGALNATEIATAIAIRRYDDETAKRDGDPWRLHELAHNVRHRYDRDQNRYVERPEWPGPSSGLTHIGVADEDDNGEVSHVELLAWLDDLRSLLPKSLQALDTNQDGQVNRAEFASDWTSAKAIEFASHDVNGDGLITSDEQSAQMVLRDGRQTYSNDRPRVVAQQSEIYSDIHIDSDHVITDVNLRLSITTLRQQLLDIYLIAPDGQRVALYTGELKPWERVPIFEDTVFDDEAAEISTTLKRPPRKRAIRPRGVGQDGQSSLRAFYGKQAAGTWRLVISTARSNSPALLHSWSLLITPAD